MNIRKTDKKRKFHALTPLALRILQIGLVLIYLSLFRLIFEITASPPFSAAAADDFGAMLEYPVAALMLLTASTYLADRATREKDT